MAVVTTVMTGPLVNRIYRRPVEIPEPAVRASGDEKVPA